MLTDPRDYLLEINGIETPERPRTTHESRPWLSVYFACCSVYQRVYRSKDGTHYDARCPHCARSMRFGVGAGGTSNRRFVVE